MSTFSIKESEVDKKWLLIDAENQVLGRLSSEVAKILRGKHKPDFTPHMDAGDYVVVINAEKVKLTGRKSDPKDGKIYYYHTEHPGGLKSNTAGKILNSDNPERVVKMSVKRMLPGGKLSRKQFSHLYVYSGSEHKHNAQNPVIHKIAKKKYEN